MNTSQKSIRDNKVFEYENLFNLFNKGCFDDVIRISRETISSGHQSQVIYNLLGYSLSCIKRDHEAIDIYLEGLKIYPNDADLNNNIALSFVNLKDYKKAENFINKATSLNPNKSEIHYTSGVISNALGNKKKALYSFKKSFNCNPENFDALLEVGNIYKDLKKFNDAVAIYRKLGILSPLNPLAKYNEAAIHIRNGRFNFGWQLFDKNLKSNLRQFINGYLEEETDLWDGETINGKLLIYGEQGLGDQIMFGSLIYDLLEVHKNVAIKVDYRLKTIFQRTFPEIDVFDENYDSSKIGHSHYLAMGSLCKYFRSEKQKFENKKLIKFVVNSQLKKEIDHTFLNNSLLKIGLSWNSISEKNGAERSLSKGNIIKLIKKNNHSFINLQYGNHSKLIEEIYRETGKQIFTQPGIDLTNDIDGLLSVIQNCDLIITIDNTTAHLASSLGKPVWILLPYSANFRWLEKTSNSLWYKNAILYRQSSDRIWEPVINEIIKQLTNYRG